MRCATLLAAGLLLAGCEPAQQSAARPSLAPSQPFQAAGPTDSVDPEIEPTLQWAASVVQLHELEGQGAKVFGTAGGDPAVNGLYTYIAFYESPAEGWRVFRLGDFESWTVAGEGPGRVELEARQSSVDQTSGEITTRPVRLIVAWTKGPEDRPPARVEVTPAR
ncbi:hypothetical protein Q0812_13075 [Brevundimonas sp. 2R-24]|uniref:DUF4822 domain-containing protein n=1 Tax=Peiella sedimenti TaxID=3061083 RepID=A0ABT8SPF1_9CAUL|nr:hypothetical protein [Caulobacteraceae bacterium XZ-24]